MYVKNKVGIPVRLFKKQIAIKRTCTPVVVCILCRWHKDNIHDFFNLNSFKLFIEKQNFSKTRLLYNVISQVLFNELPYFFILQGIFAFIY